jgi:hypothetical protein
VKENGRRGRGSCTLISLQNGQHTQTAFSISTPKFTPLLNADDKRYLVEVL